LLALLERRETPLSRIVVDLSFTTDLDLSTIRMLADVARRAQAAGVAVLLADAHHRVRAVLARERLGTLLGDLTRAYSIAELVDSPGPAAPVP
jgi:anti-anti-sigma regulatory factor